MKVKGEAIFIIALVVVVVYGAVNVRINDDKKASALLSQIPFGRNFTVESNLLSHYECIVTPKTDSAKFLDAISDTTFVSIVVRDSLYQFPVTCFGQSVDTIASPGAQYVDNSFLIGQIVSFAGLSIDR